MSGLWKGAVIVVWHQQGWVPLGLTVALLWRFERVVAWLNGGD